MSFFKKISGGGCVILTLCCTYVFIQSFHQQLTNDIYVHRRTGRHFTGGVEKICPESNFFSLIRLGPETSCKSVLYG